MLWLDAARFEDTRGFHGDGIHPAWPFRDYVLNSFRENKPFDQFTREQLAGDLLPDSTTEQKVASAFNRVLRTSEEGGIQDKEYLAKYGADRVRTVAADWLGITMGCAECHDHKFDPIKQKDFHSMKAFFADLNERGILPGTGPDAWLSKIKLPSEEQSRRLAEVTDAVQRAEKALEDKTSTVAAHHAQWERQLAADIGAGALKWQYQRPIAVKSAHGAQLTIYNDEQVEMNTYYVPMGNGTLDPRRAVGNGLIVASGPNPDNETYTVTLKPGAGTWTALGVQPIQDETLPGNRQARGADRFVLTEVDAELAPTGKGTAKKLRFVLATTDGFGERPENPPMAVIDGDPSTGWGGTSKEGKSPFLALRFAEPVTTQANSVITVRLHHDSVLRRATIGRLRLALSAGRYSWPDLGDGAVDAGLEVDEVRLVKGGVRDGVPVVVLDALKVPAERRTEAQIKALKEQFQWSSPETQFQFAELERLRAAKSELESAIPTVMVSEAIAIPRETRILPRGNWMDDSGEIVQPAVPGFLGHLDTGDRRATRLDLANWLVSRDNPLTARAFANRTWRQLFGTGLSIALDDLGSRGEWPTHPELLDLVGRGVYGAELASRRRAPLGCEAPPSHHCHEPHLPSGFAEQPATWRARPG